MKSLRQIVELKKIDLVPDPESQAGTVSDFANPKSEAEKNHIEQIYQDALKLEHENEKLNQEHLQLKTELQLAQNNSQIEQDTSQRNWFIVGALVLFFGIVIGFIMPKMLSRRRY